MAFSAPLAIVASRSPQVLGRMRKLFEISSQMAGVITASVVVPQSACLRPSNRPVGNLSLPLSLSISRRIQPTATISIVPAQRSNRLMFVVRRKAIEETFALTGLVLKVVGLTFG